MHIHIILYERRLKNKMKICQVYCRHLGFDLYMTLKRKNNNSDDNSVLKLVKNEILHKILGILCKKFKIKAGR